MSHHTITAALPYANGPIHLGHIAGVYLPADIYARYLRLKNKDVVFVCGSDEHGVPITLKAKKENKTPQEVVDYYHQHNQKALQDFGISFDIFFRTSDPRHHQTAQAFFRRLYTQEKLTVQENEQFFDEEKQQFLADRYIQGACPYCHYPKAYGDQCESCGKSLQPQELVAPKSMLSGAKPVMKSTRHAYLPLDQYQDFFQEWILAREKNWKKNVYGQCKSWINAGLSPRAITRDLDWGVSVNIDGDVKKVLYVWFDAPIGYISATQVWAAAQGKKWQDYWQRDAKLVHFIGKDNIVFHCIIFPAMLKAHGDYVLPTHVPANEFLNLEGKKISTSQNWAVWLADYLQNFPHQQDVLRYVLCANAPETKDNDFTWKDFQAKNNHELLATLGNFVHRTFTLLHRHFSGEVPVPAVLMARDKEILLQCKKMPKKVGEAIEKYQFREGISYIMSLAHLGNKYLADTTPWQILAKDKKQAGNILYICVQIIHYIAILSAPFLPDTSQKLKKILNCDTSWLSLENDALIPGGTLLNKHDILFSSISNEMITHMIQLLGDS